MKYIFLVLLISLFGFTVNKEDYYNITKNTVNKKYSSDSSEPSGPIFIDVNEENFNKKYLNLKKENTYYFVLPSELGKYVYYSIRTNYSSGDIFKSIDIYNYQIYNDYYMEGYNIESIPLSYKKLDDESAINFNTYLRIEGTKYLGIELKLNYDLNYLIMTIVSDNKITIDYNQMKTRALYPLIPYFYWIDISNDSNKEITVYISANAKYKPFINFNITEHSSENSYIIPTVVIANFRKSNNIYELSYSYVFKYKPQTKYVSFDFISNYEVGDFKILMDKPLDSSGIIFNEQSTDSFNKAYLNLDKENIYYFVFPIELGKIAYCSIITNYLSSNIFNSINIYNYKIYDSDNKEGYQTSSIPLNYKKIEDESAINFNTYLSIVGSKYLGIQLNLNSNLNYLSIVVESNNKFNLKNNQADTRTFHPLIPYFYWSDISKNPEQELNVYISIKYIKNKPFETFNITEHPTENSYFPPTVVQANFNITNDIYVLSFSYKAKYPQYNQQIKYVSFDFISDYELEDFTIVIKGPSDEEGTKIFGLSVLTFSLIVSGAVIIIAAIVIVVIFIIYKRRKSSSGEQLVESSNQPLFPDSNK